MSLDEAYRQRADALVGVRGYGDDVAPVAPDPEPASLGARGGQGYAWQSRPVQASVYLFDSYDAARTAEDSLRGQALDPGRQSAVTVNGPMLLWATGDDAATGLLDDLLGSFSGEE